jgi:hypothetical protein
VTSSALARWRRTVADNWVGFVVFGPLLLGLTLQGGVAQHELVYAYPQPESGRSYWTTIVIPFVLLVVAMAAAAIAEIKYGRAFGEILLGTLLLLASGWVSVGMIGSALNYLLDSRREAHANVPVVQVIFRERSEGTRWGKKTLYAYVAVNDTEAGQVFEFRFEPKAKTDGVGAPSAVDYVYGAGFFGDAYVMAANRSKTHQPAPTVTP